MPADSTDLPTAFAIAGVDEVGRGPLAGPVVAAAVILDPRHPVDGLDDSKRLDEAERERLDVLVRRHAVAWCIAAASVEEIDRLNILNASLLAMQRAVAGLGHGAELPAAEQSGQGGRPASAPPGLVLIDGNRCPDLDLPCAAIVKGDGRVRCIGAASIIAKVARDRYMVEQDEHFPGYGFARHKGYGTAQHCEALATLGATSLHRRSFSPVQRALAQDAGALERSKTAQSPPTDIASDIAGSKVAATCSAGVSVPRP